MKEIETSWTKDPRQAQQFISRKAASKACEAIGFPKRCAYSVDIMGFKIWTIADDHCRMLTESGYKALASDSVRANA